MNFFGALWKMSIREVSCGHFSLEIEGRKVATFLAEFSPHFFACLVHKFRHNFALGDCWPNPWCHMSHKSLNGVRPRD